MAGRVVVERSYWLLAQMEASDCQRVSGLKFLLLRKVGTANLAHFEAGSDSSTG